MSELLHLPSVACISKLQTTISESNAYSARFLWALERVAFFPSPIFPTVLLVGVDFSVFPSGPGLFMLGCVAPSRSAASSRADMAACISLNPPAICSFALRFTRRLCDLEDGSGLDPNPRERRRELAWRSCHGGQTSLRCRRASRFS